MRGRSATGTDISPSTIRAPWRRSRGFSMAGRGRTLRVRWPCSNTRRGGCAAIRCCCPVSPCWPDRWPLRARRPRPGCTRRCASATRVDARFTAAARGITPGSRRVASFCAGTAAAIPAASSGPEMVKALQRAGRTSELGVGRVDVDGIPANRLQVLARTGLGSKGSALARLGEPKRTATLVAVVRHLEAVAVDDTLDLFALLMATRLFSPARRASAEHYAMQRPTFPVSAGRGGRPLAAPHRPHPPDRSGPGLEITHTGTPAAASGATNRAQHPGRLHVMGLVAVPQRRPSIFARVVAPHHCRSVRTEQRRRVHPRAGQRRCPLPDDQERTNRRAPAMSDARRQTSDR